MAARDDSRRRESKARIMASVGLPPSRCVTMTPEWVGGEREGEVASYGHRVPGVRALCAGLSGPADRADPDAAGPQALDGGHGTRAGAGGAPPLARGPLSTMAVPDGDAGHRPGAPPRG